MRSVRRQPSLRHPGPHFGSQKAIQGIRQILAISNHERQSVLMMGSPHGGCITNVVNRSLFVKGDAAIRPRKIDEGFLRAS